MGFLSFLSPQTLMTKAGVLAVILLVGVIGGYKIASWRYEASNAQAEAKYAELLKADQARLNDAENKATEQRNDLNKRLTAAKVAAAKHPATGICFNADSVRIINSAIGSPATSK